MPAVLERDFKRHQTRLLPFAYNITGDVLAAEDVVQEVLSSFFMGSHESVENKDAYLTRAVINRAINAKKSIQARKRHYIGQWLPVPVYTDDQIYRLIDRKEVLDYSLLVLLEKLSIKERAVFILKESFEFEHSEIAEVLGITVENCRQIFKRANQKLEGLKNEKGFRSTRAEDANKALSQALLTGDIQKVKEVLSAQVLSYSDGGDQRAAINVIEGPDNVAKLLKAVYGKYMYEGTTITLEELNHRPAIIFSAGDVIYRCMICDVKDGLIQKLYIIINPAKLRALKK